MKTNTEMIPDPHRTDPAEGGSAGILAARQASKASVAFGAVLTVLGIFAVLAPLFTGVAVTVLVGMLLIAGGVAAAAFAFGAESVGKGALKFLFGALCVVAGVAVVATPMASLGALTFVLAGFFLVSGVADIIFALKKRGEEGWGWMLFSGIVSLLLGILIIAQWPVSGAWAVGLLVGVRLLMHGWVLMALGKTGQETITHLQDTRIEMLERHLREGAEALQQTQAALADHTAMLLALDAELRRKVSSDEIDPAVQALNRKLAEARKWMRESSAATRESWDKTQQEANAAFAKLQTGIAETSASLRKELGLDEPAPPASR